MPLPPFRIAIALLMVCAGSGPSIGQQSLPQSQEAQTPTLAPRPDFGESVGNGRPGVFMQVPVTHLFPGAQPSSPTIKNPVQGDPKALERGMTYYVNLNCVGCHAPNGGGGMGPALSNSVFIYGSQPENIYLYLPGPPERHAGMGRSAARFRDLGSRDLYRQDQQRAKP